MSEQLLSIVELMEVEEAERDLDWLKMSLQNAILLELSTLPPYLFARWSINLDSKGDVTTHFRETARQEMQHMGLACNMLTTIGGTPKLTGSVVPSYPGPLPGGVRPQLTVRLGRLSKEIVSKVFMEIEYPENGPLTFFEGRCYPTIGAFYSAIRKEFQKLQDHQVTGKRQITQAGLVAIKTKEHALKAIDEIKEQGEGTSSNPLGPFGELAHYYRFGEILHERKLIKLGNKWMYLGDSVPFPEEIAPVADVPPGGYPGVSGAFDKLYSQMLQQMEAAWATENGDLKPAINTMYKLEPQAKTLMSTPIPGTQQTYGPSFLWVP